MDQHSACKEIYAFLGEVDDTKADSVQYDKPKCFVTKDPKENIIGKAIFMKDDKARFVFNCGEQLTVDGADRQKISES
eukprot:5012290-Ditylum_brightwellii.AAC.1